MGAENFTEDERIRAFGFDKPPVDDSEGMRDGVEVLGVVVFVTVAAAVLVGLLILGMSVWGVPR